MRAIDLTLLTPEENLALDEALLLRLEGSEPGGAAPQEVLRFWESPVHFVVLGTSGRVREEVNLEACAREGVPVLRRASGGGTVLQGPGCLNFALVLSLEAREELSDVRFSFTSLLGRVAEALELPGARLEGTSDLAVGGRKFSGNAQKRTRRGLLHHGTVLHRFDLELMGRCLREPGQAPAYRAGRAHRDFLQNLPLPAAEIKTRLASSFGAGGGGRFQLPSLEGLIREKYGNPEWVRRF